MQQQMKAYYRAEEEFKTKGNLSDDTRRLLRNNGFNPTDCILEFNHYNLEGVQCEDSYISRPDATQEATTIITHSPTISEIIETQS